MKILILHSIKSKLKGFILLNLVYNKLVKVFSEERLEFDLVIKNGVDKDNVFFQNNWFKNIQFFPGFKDLWKRKKINYDLIINLSNTPYSIFYYYISRGLKKNTLHWFNRRKISEKSNFEAESILAKKMIQKIIKNDEVELDLPSLKIEKEKLENTENLIDWLLRTENLKPLSLFKYIFFYLENSEAKTKTETILEMINLTLAQKKLKVIVVIEGKRTSEKESKLVVALKKIHNKNFYLNFKDYNDFYYILKFTEKTLFSITDSSYLNTIGEIKKWRMIYLENKILKDFESTKAIEYVSYHLKNLNPL